MFFFRKKIEKGPLQPKIEVFVRHCNFSAASAHKKRSPNFSKRACFENLISTSDERVHFTHFLDTAYEGEHFLKGKAIEIKKGTEAGSFLAMLDFVKEAQFHPDTAIYFVEDDYLHRPGWVDALIEAFDLPVDYITLYDHLDKYLEYPKLQSKIFVTSSCHWRTTPSTTNTYAMRASSLMQDLSVHRRFSLGRKITADHDKFTSLKKKGRVLISAVPGFSTHAEPKFSSPRIDWEPFYKESLCTQLH